jgi:DNA-directed RNA polymerase subunit beta
MLLFVARRCSSVPEHADRLRRDFSKTDSILEMPDFLQVQLGSYQEFLQADIPFQKRESQGLQAVFQEVFPISDPRENFTLEFVKYELGRPKYTVSECIERDMTYAAPLKATLRLVVREDVEDKKRVRDIIEQPVYLGELPRMTDRGTFIINGSERVVVSQLHRSPGVFFEEEIHPNGRRLYSARVIPYHGSWLEFTLDINDVMHVHIERRRKIPASVLLRALGYEKDEQILSLFYGRERARVVESGALVDRVAAADVPDPDLPDGAPLLAAGERITEDKVSLLLEAGVKEIAVITDHPNDQLGIMLRTLERDPTTAEKDALVKIYNLLRPGDPPNLETARNLLYRLFFDPKRYDLGEVGRYKLNDRLGLPEDGGDRVLRVKDFVTIMDTLRGLGNGRGKVDDIDHLGNRRTKSVGELLANQFSLGLSRMARIVRERMSLHTGDSPKPYDLVNARTVSAVVDAFFGSSQLSQFMDQTNPLAELTHKRRLSALGPGGLTRERAGFEVRDVHHTHYGRMCPVETPEGPNIGLISSLSTYARINRLGFLETPYRRVVDGGPTDDVVYLTADQEERYCIAQANEPLDAKGRLVNERIMVRKGGEFPVVTREDVTHMDVSPLQLVSVSAGLIPFLEHDDANRALMGSNMQRQAVPLLRTEAPLVGTGLEAKAAADSGAVLIAKRDGLVERVTADTIVIDCSQGLLRGDPTELLGLDTYHLMKFARSNQDTCMNQKPIVRRGQRVRAGQPVADGPATADGELALGMNVLVAFMPWLGYNFEDAIVVSERLVRQDKFTSLHIEEFELEVRDTKRGLEEITREIPNVSEAALRHLDEDGIVRVGAEVKAGDILVGKVTPKGEAKLSPEERLLRAIFGDKARDVKDASLKAPPGMDGVVIDVKVFSRRERDERVRAQERKRVAQLEKERDATLGKIAETRDHQVQETLKGQIAMSMLDIESFEPLVEPGQRLKGELLKKLDIGRIRAAGQLVEDAKASDQAVRVIRAASEAEETAVHKCQREIERVTRGDELPPGVVKLVKVYVARKRKLDVGDKMAGRHGNKGVVAKTVPEEDMPYLADGTPIDIVLNPLGVPSRMNVGQILETHLGWASHELGVKVATPVFNGALLEEIRGMLSEAELPENGKTVVYDGRTGVPFAEPVTVGYIYTMKLSHLAADKLHARSIGPYSLVTQQPLGGKAQFGGQRFGEMEVWALEAYGAAYTLQELLTVKSDDVLGRSRMYEAVVKGENPPEAGIPESFKVLVKELQSLCLDVRLEEY